MELLNSDFKGGDQFVSMKSKDLTSLFFVRYNLRYYQVPGILFYSYRLFRSCSVGPLLASGEARKAL